MFPVSENLLTVLHQSPGGEALPPSKAGPSVQPASSARWRLRGQSPPLTVSTSLAIIKTRCSAANTEVALCCCRSKPAKQND